MLITRLRLMLLAVCLLGSGYVQAQRIKEIASVAGLRGNQLIGYGLVVGLDGTGDSSGQISYAGQSIQSLLSSLGVALPPAYQGSPRNVAAVMVTAELPALARPGQTLDVTVSSIGNSRSLRGGTLLMTPLRAANGQVYAQAQGSLVVPAAGAQVGQSRVTVNQLAAGRIPAGAFVEQAAPEADVGPLVELNFRKSDFAQTQKAVEAMIRLVGQQAVIPVDARTVNVRVPTEPQQRLALMAQLLELQVDSVADPAKVVLNARTGSVVMNQSVKLAPFAVTHGNLTVRVQAQSVVIQPPSFSLGTTANQRNAGISVDTGPKGNLMMVEEGASLDQVVRALNLLGTSSQDLMAILQAMKAAGALKADLEII